MHGRYPAVRHGPSNELSPPRGENPISTPQPGPVRRLGILSGIHRSRLSSDYWSPRFLLALHTAARGRPALARCFVTACCWSPRRRATVGVMVYRSPVWSIVVRGSWARFLGALRSSSLSTKRVHKTLDNRLDSPLNCLFLKRLRRAPHKASRARGHASFPVRCARCEQHSHPAHVRAEDRLRDGHGAQFIGRGLRQRRHDGARRQQCDEYREKPR